MDFTTMMAISVHDTKNAIGTIINALDEILDAPEGESREDRQKLAHLQYEARRVNVNLVQLLTLFRTSGGLYKPRFEPRLVYEILEDYTLLNGSLMNHHGVTCEIDCDEDLVWSLDSAMVTAVLENTVTNSIRYTRDHLRLAAATHDGWLHLDVDDNGSGFPPEMVGRRTIDHKAPLDPAAGRTGLGLYFCALIAQMHRAGEREGFIEISNDGTLGGGRFRIALPSP